MTRHFGKAKGEPKGTFGKAPSKEDAGGKSKMPRTEEDKGKGKYPDNAILNAKGKGKGDSESTQYQQYSDSNKSIGCYEVQTDEK